MSELLADLLAPVARSPKPRERGLTHVLDRGLSIGQVQSFLEVAGEFVDIVKLGWGTAVITPNLQAKLECYRSHEIPVVLGGTLTELAVAQGRFEVLLERIASLGLSHIEISDGTITLAHEDKLALIERCATSGLTVLSEVGSKDDTRIMAPYRWVALITRELTAGAWRVIAEARESGTVGIFRHDGEVRMGLIDEIAHGVAPAQVIFEAPRKDQQVWFVRRFGPEVNLGNIAPEDVLSLETIRRGLRSDTAVSRPQAPPQAAAGLGAGEDAGAGRDPACGGEDVVGAAPHG